MPEPYVTSVTVKNGKIELSVMVDDFKRNVSGGQSAPVAGGQSAPVAGGQSAPVAGGQSGEEIYVEISGQASQTGGAFANFYDIRQVPAKPEDDDHYYIYVQGKPLPHEFLDNEQVTVWLRVSRAWLSVLGQPDGFVPLGQTAGEGMTWDKELSVTQISGDRYS